MSYCPNKNTKEYQEMKEALGDNLTHYIWNENNGNPIHLASNGKESKLFNDLLELTRDKTKAIQAKAQVYSKEFRGWFGDWLNPTIFTAWNVDNINKLKEKYPSDLPNKYYHHSTNNFGLQKFNDKENSKSKLKIVGRLTTNKIDALIVDNKDSNNKYSHITLATAEGIKPFESNKEIENNLDKIQPLNDTIDVTFKNNPNNQVSKIIDENGEPLIVYHGSNKNFDRFIKELNGSNTNTKDSRLGIFFSDNKLIAKTYSNKNLYSSYLNGRNLKIINDLNKYNGTKFASNISKAKSSNYDSILFKNVNDNNISINNVKSDIYSVFNSNQIKSAIPPSLQQEQKFNLDKNKIGKFDEKSDNIYYQKSNDININSTFDKELNNKFKRLFKKLYPNITVKEVDKIFENNKNLNQRLKVIKQLENLPNEEVQHIKLPINDKLLNLLNPVLKELNDKNMQPLIVGGAVRDALLGKQPKDIDIEIYNVSIEDLQKILSKYGKVNEVGKSFGILKFIPYDETGNLSKIEEPFDFSIPRKESKTGKGHKEFKTEFDKNISIKDASSRRDFTWNSIGYNPITETLYDYYHGLKDIKEGIIRHTTDKFKEDPLRILRAMQFQSRMGHQIAPETISIIREMVKNGDLDNLPKERLEGEWLKWAIKGSNPQYIFNFLRDTGIGDKYFPELMKLKNTQQDFEYHPEGDVEEHTKQVLIKANKIANREKLSHEEKAVLIFASLLHDISKPAVTEKKYIEKKGREVVTSKGHEKLGSETSIDILQRIGIRKSILNKVRPLIKEHLAHATIMSIDTDKGKISAFIKLTKRLESASIEQLTNLMEADMLGRNNSDKTKNDIKTLQEFDELIQKVKNKYGNNLKVKPLITGNDLINLGFKSGKELGNIVKTALEAQYNQEFSNRQEALNWLSNFLNGKHLINKEYQGIKFNQQNNNEILGQANIEAKTILINAKLQHNDTLPHEYAHHYIRMFYNTPIVQEGIKRFGSEEALVQAIGEQAVKQEGEAWNWWKQFTNWILTKLSKQDLLHILTDSFLTNKNLSKNNNTQSKNLLHNIITTKENDSKNVIDTILNSNKIKSGNKIILNKIKDILPFNLKIILDNDYTYGKMGIANNAIGYYETKTNTIHLSQRASINTLIHELIHVATIIYLHNNSEYNDYFNKVKQHFNNIGITEKEVYGLNNKDEFIAELFSNPRFMQLLKSHPPIENKTNRNIWNELWSLIQKWLELNTNNDNLLLEAFEKSSEIVDDISNYSKFEEEIQNYRNILPSNENDNNQSNLSDYSKKLLLGEDELLKDKSRAIRHFDKPKEYESLKNKVIKINNKQSYYIAYIDKVLGEDKEKANREYLTVGLKRLNEKEYLLRKEGLLTLDNYHHLKYVEPIKTDKSFYSMQNKIRFLNTNMIKYKYYIEDLGNKYRYNIKQNPKYLEDLVSLVTNYDKNINLKLLSDNMSNNKYWNYMVSKLGLETTAKIFIENNHILLNNEDTNKFINLYNEDVKPNDYYDDKYKVNEDESENYDYAISYDDEYENAKNESKQISEFLDTLIYDHSSELLNINYSDKDIEMPEVLGDMIVDFKNKMIERYNIMQNRLNKITNKNEKNKLYLDLNVLHKLIYQSNLDNNNLWVISNYLSTDLKEMKINLDNNAIDIDKLTYYKEVLNLWESIINDWKNNKSNTFYEYLKNNYVFQKTLIKQISAINELNQKLLDLDQELYLQNANEVMNNNLKMKDFQKINEIGKVNSLIFDLSRTGNKLTDSIFKILNNASNISSLKFKLFNEELIEKMKKLSKSFDLSKKDTQLMLLETDDKGILTGNILGRYTPEYTIELDKLLKLRKRINNNKTKDKNYISAQIKSQEDELFNYVDLNKLLNEQGMLSKQKLDKYKQELLQKYDEDKVNDIISDIIEKDKLFQETAVSTKEWMYDKIMTDTKYEVFRAKRSYETEDEYNNRINDLLDQEYQNWYNKNNPYYYLMRRHKDNTILNGNAYKFLTYIPNSKYESNKFKELQTKTELYDFYKYYIDKLNEYKQYLPSHISDKLLYNFLPRVKRDLAQKLRDGNGFIKSIQESIIENNSVGLSSTVKHLDVLGNEVYKIPLRFLSLSTTELEIMINTINKKLKRVKNPIYHDELLKKKQLYINRQSEINDEMSTDLIKIIKSFAIMAENYKAFNEIEDTIKTGSDILKHITNITTKQNTKQAGRKDNSVKNIKKGAENLIAMTDFTIKSLMYQKRKEHRQVGNIILFKDNNRRKEYNKLKGQLKIINKQYIEGKITQFAKWSKEAVIENKISDLFEEENPNTITTDTITRSATNITGIATLGFNIKSALNNYLFGKLSLQTHAAGNEDYSLSELKQAYKIINKTLRIGTNTQLKTKLKHLSELFNVVFEVNEAAYGAKSALEEKTSNLDWIKAYGGTKKGEYYLQNVTLVALLLHNKIKVKQKQTGKILEVSLWDAYNSDGKFKSEYSYLNSNTNKYENNNIDYQVPDKILSNNKFIELLNKIQQINKLIHGNYDPRSPMQIKSKDWGTVLMQYKTWIPEGIAQRFEKEISDDMLGRHRKGRYRTMWELGLFNSFGTLLKSFFNAGNISENDMKDIDYANMRKNLIEFRYLIILGMGQFTMRLMVSSLKGSDEDWKLKTLRTLLNQLSRLNNDLSFYLNPQNVLQTAKEPLPAVQYVGRWLQWLSNARKLGVPGYNSKTYTVKKWLWSGSKNVPAIGEIKKWYSEMERLNSDQSQ